MKCSIEKRIKNTLLFYIFIFLFFREIRYIQTNIKLNVRNATCENWWKKNVKKQTMKERKGCERVFNQFKHENVNVRWHLKKKRESIENAHTNRELNRRSSETVTRNKAATLYVFAPFPS